MDTREKLIELIMSSGQVSGFARGLADYLIANGVTIQKWIPVTKRLPKDGDTVLTYYQDGKVRVIQNNGGFPMVLSNELDWVRVTHWMPLPEPPKGE